MKKQSGFLIALTVLAAMIILGLFKCPLYEIFGLPCPTCGMTRSWGYVLKLDFVSAFSMHPLFFMPLVLFIPRMRKKWVLFTIFGIFIAVYILRMILLFPDTVPMNYNYNSLLGGLFK